MLEYRGRRIHLVGTAHVSRASVAEVRRLIETVQPDTVCVELDEARLEAAFDETRWRKLDVEQLIRDGRAFFFLASLALGAFQKRLGDRLGIRPGAEMLEAVRLAREQGAHLVLADRHLRATLERSYARLSRLDKVKLFVVLAASFFLHEELTEEQIEELKQRGAIGDAMATFARQMPSLQVPLIDERDRFLIASVRAAPGRSVVAVVGAAHVAGMVRYLDTPIDREALSELPRPSLGARLAPWLLPALVAGAFALGWRAHGRDALRPMALAWLVPNLLTGVGFGIVAGARPLTLLAAALASPLLPLSPALGGGRLAGSIEVWARPPRLPDRDGLYAALGSLRTFYANRITRVLLVALASAIGTALGAWVGVGWLLTLL